MLVLMLVLVLPLLLLLVFAFYVRVFSYIWKRSRTLSHARVVELAPRPGQLSTTFLCDIDGDFKTGCICMSLDVVLERPKLEVGYGLWYAKDWWSQR